eukprot:1706980-Prymnesium_polylepis.1
MAVVSTVASKAVRQAAARMEALQLFVLLAQAGAQLPPTGDEGPGPAGDEGASAGAAVGAAVGADGEGEAAVHCAH